MPDLYPYQIEGRDYLARRRKAWLCDVPGLGKTAQCIAAWRQRKARTVIVVCPGMVRSSWARAIPEFDPDGLPPSVLRTDRSAIAPGRVVVVSYDALLNPQVHKQLSELQADVLVCDESHNLKEPDAQRTAAVLGAAGLARTVKAVWLVTGTPLMNHAGEAWTTLITLFPSELKAACGGGALPSYDEFLRRFCHTRPTRWGLSVKGTKDTAAVRRLLAPCMLRRTWKDVRSQMPPVQWGDLLVSPDDIPDADVDMWRNSEEVDGRIFRQFVDACQNPDDPDLQALVGDRHIAELRRWTGLAKVRPAMTQIIDELRDGTMDKVLIFGIHSMVLKLARGYLRQAGMKPRLLYGGSSEKKRELALDAFINAKGCRALVAQIKVAGTGVDGLQKSCNNVILLEADWNPSVNYQAVARLQRTGQTRTVFARFAALENSLDHFVQASMRRKTREIAEMIG